MLTKDGNGVETIGYYQEILFRKLDRNENVTVRANGFLGIKIGKVKTVGFKSFQLGEEDKTICSILYEDLLDVS